MVVLGLLFGLVGTDVSSGVTRYGFGVPELYDGIDFVPTRPFYLLGQHFAFIDAIGQRQRQEEQIELFLAMMAKLQADARAKFGAPLVILYSWPDEQTKQRYGDSKVAQPLLVDTLVRLRKLGAPMLGESAATSGTDVAKLLIPHDGHPSAVTTELIAAALKKLLQAP